MEGAGLRPDPRPRCLKLGYFFRLMQQIRKHLSNANDGVSCRWDGVPGPHHVSELHIPPASPLSPRPFTADISDRPIRPHGVVNNPLVKWFISYHRTSSTANAVHTTASSTTTTSFSSSQGTIHLYRFKRINRCLPFQLTLIFPRCRRLTAAAYHS
jgi:hypothetical protein